MRTEEWTRNLARDLADVISSLDQRALPPMLASELDYLRQSLADGDSDAAVDWLRGVALLALRLEAEQLAEWSDPTIAKRHVHELAARHGWALALISADDVAVHTVSNAGSPTLKPSEAVALTRSPAWAALQDALIRAGRDNLPQARRDRFGRLHIHSPAPATSPGPEPGPEPGPVADPLMADVSAPHADPPGSGLSR